MGKDWINNTVCKSEFVTPMPFLWENAVQQDQYENFKNDKYMLIRVLEATLFLKKLTSTFIITPVIAF